MRVAIGAALLACALAGPAAAGGVYMYVDDRGVTHFTNDPRGDDRFKPMTLRRELSRRVPKHRAPKSRKYDPLITSAAYHQGLPPALIKAVIAAESAFDSQAVSHAGAQGLMQLMPATAASLGVNNAFEPAQNVHGGSAYLRKMLDRYGDVSRALAAYNAGPTAVDRYGGIPPYRETKAYVERVLTYYRRYHGDFPR
ncbi:MAG: lytic transglycosylase domain-containing protein [Myxococcota bacterium]